MIRWIEPDPARHRTQEVALLALNDRMHTVEQLLTLMGDTQRQMIVAHAREVKALTTRIADLETRLARHCPVPESGA